MKHVEFKQMESDPEHSSSRCCLNKKVKTWFLLKTTLQQLTTSQRDPTETWGSHFDLLSGQNVDPVHLTGNSLTLVSHLFVKANVNSNAIKI